MSIIGILSSNLFSAGAAQNTQNSQNTPSAFQQIKTEFQQLGQDLQSGNLSGAQSDFATLSQNLSAANQSSATTANSATGQQRDSAGFCSIGAGPPVGKSAGGAEGFHEPSAGCATGRQPASRRAPRPPASPRGKLATFIHIFPAVQPDRSGLQHAGARFASGESIRSTIRFFGATK